MCTADVLAGAWEMLGSLVNGGTLYLRGSDWNATLEQVGAVFILHLNALTDQPSRLTHWCAPRPSSRNTNK